MLISYPACFIGEPTGYSVIFPDLNIATCGNTLEDAVMMSMDCLALHLSSLKEDGTVVPSASAMDQIDLAEIAEDVAYFPEDSFVRLISVNLKEYAESKFENLPGKTLLEKDVLVALYKNYEEIPEDVLSEVSNFVSYITAHVPNSGT